MLERLRSRRGSVMVLIGVAMFPIVGILTFAIDVSHWFDYSRNLQNRADAAALAGGQMLGNCLATGGAGDTNSGMQSTAGKFAQLFSGASVGETPAPPSTFSATAAPLPYTDAEVYGTGAGSNGPGTGWDVATYGYANNMTQPYNAAGSAFNGTYSPLTLRAGLRNINNFWVALNASNYSPQGGLNTSFTMNPAGTPATFCSSDPTFDATDKQCFGQAHGQTTGPCAVNAMVDVKLTQKSVPLFIPFFTGNPTITAHARVTLQGEGSSPFVRPIAVADPGSFACATVIFKEKKPGGDVQLARRDLTETTPATFSWDNVANPVTVPIPTDSNGSGGLVYTYMQVFLHDCSNNGETFDDSTNSGIEVLNGWDTGLAPVAGEAPKIMAGGVTLAIAGGNGATCTNAATDQYFSVGGCSAGPTVNATFNPSVTNPNNQASITAVDTSTGQSLSLKPNNAGTVWAPSGNQGFNIGDSTGQHLIRIDWTQSVGTVNGQNCATTTCTGSFGIQQQSFGACNGCDQPDDSGPIVLAKICDSVTGNCNVNSFAAGSSPSLVVKLQLAGIRAAQPGNSPITVLRFASSTNHQTGLVDCGQGNGPGGSGTPGDAYTIYGGCGPNNPFEPPACTNASWGCKLPVMNPLYVYGRGNPTNCSPAVDQDYVDWPNKNNQDCVQTTPGSRRVNIVCGLLQRITGVTPANFSASSSACSGNNTGTCPANNWPNYGLDPNDPRKIDVVLTSPLDLAAADNSPQYWVPIRKFATFYVTGWDTSLFPKCPGVNDAFPVKGKLASDNGAIWGHWINDVEPGGIPDGTKCDTSSGSPTNCVPALTR